MSSGNYPALVGQATQTQLQFLLGPLSESSGKTSKASTRAARPLETVMAEPGMVGEVVVDRKIIPLAGTMLIGREQDWGKRGLDGCLLDNVAAAVALEKQPVDQAILVLLAHALAGILAALLVLHVQNRRR